MKTCFPLVAAVVPSKSIKEFALIEALILVPLVGALLGYGMSLTDLDAWLQRAITGAAIVAMIGTYGAYLRRP